MLPTGSGISAVETFRASLYEWVAPQVYTAWILPKSRWMLCCRQSDAPRSVVNNHPLLCNLLCLATDENSYKSLKDTERRSVLIR